MPTPIADLITLAQAGASILVDAREYSIEELIQLAENIRPEKDRELTLLRAVSYSPEDLLRVVEACPGKVFLGMTG